MQDGQLRTFISNETINLGTTSSSTRSSTYYDNFKSGYKDSYVNMLFLKALVAYDDLATAQLVRVQFSGSDIVNAAAGINADLTLSNGALASWIDANNVVRALGLAVPHAIAATLPMPQPEAIRAALTTLRNQARVKPGFFRTNIVPVENVTPLIWDAHHSWADAVTVAGIPGYPRYYTGQRGYWHLFADGAGDGLGSGNYGLLENNGGVLLSSTAYIFAAGPYPEMLQDYKGLITTLGRIGSAVKTHTFNASTDPDAHLQIPIGQLQAFCSQAYGARSSERDFQNLPICNFYKDITYSLPEGGAFVAMFVDGLLNLRIASNGSATFYGQQLDNVSRSVQIGSNFPPELAAINVAGYDVWGRSKNISCTRAGLALTCNLSDAGPVGPKACSSPRFSVGDCTRECRLSDARRADLKTDPDNCPAGYECVACADVPGGC